MEKGLCCGVFFSYFVLKALARQEEYDKLYELLTNDTPHGWKNMLDEGATAAFEAWGKEQKWNTSLCHPWASAPVLCAVEDLMGIRFEAGHIVRQTPHLPKGVTMDITGGLF